MLRLSAEPLVNLVPKTTVVFSEKAGLMKPPNDENRKSWDALIPIGRGFVNISDAEAETYDLKPGISTASGVDRYAVAMFHQLHCLVSDSPALHEKGPS